MGILNEKRCIIIFIYKSILEIRYILESLFVGCYSLLMYLFISNIITIKNSYLTFFFVGFLKHTMGYFLNIHEYYYRTVCNKGNENTCKTTMKSLFIESIFEGFFFILVGSLLSLVATSKVAVYFTIGVLLHIISEHIGLHKVFCRNKCAIIR